MSFGFSHVLFLTDLNEVWGCGQNSSFELGLGFQEHQEPIYTYPVLIRSLKNTQIKKVVAGTFSAAINSSDQILIWGQGEFGIIKSPQRLFMDKVAFLDCQISKYHSQKCSAVALDANGRVYAWGKNDCGQLGLGDSRDRKLPTQLQSLKQKQIRNIAIGDEFVVLLGKDVVISRANSPTRSRPASQERQHNSALHELPRSHKPPLKPFSSEILRQFKSKKTSMARENSDMKQSNQPEDAYATGNSHSYYSRMNSFHGDHPPHDPKGTQQSIIAELCHKEYAGHTSVTLTPNATLLDGQLAAQPLHNHHSSNYQTMNYSYTNTASHSGSTETQV